MFLMNTASKTTPYESIEEESLEEEDQRVDENYKKFWEVDGMDDFHLLLQFLLILLLFVLSQMKQKLLAFEDLQILYRKGLTVQNR